MPFPVGWYAQYYYEQSDARLVSGVSHVRMVCPYCENASTFTTKAQDFERLPGDKVEVRLVIQCNFVGCQRHTFLLFTGNEGNYRRFALSGDFFMHPLRGVDVVHESIPTAIAEDWREALRALGASAPKAAAVMFRRVLYGVLIDKNCTLHPLRTGLEQLIAHQRLPAIFDEWLPAIRDDGHDGAHPDRALNVDEANINETKEYTSELLRFIYIEPHEFKQRKARQAGVAP